MKLKTVLFSLTALFAMASTQSFAQTTAPATESTTVVQTAEQQVSAVVGDKINVNTATASELQKALIGIGAKKAEAIVQYRESHGKFTAVEQLLEVQGIGKATLEKNRERIIL